MRSIQIVFAVLFSVALLPTCAFAAGLRGTIYHDGNKDSQSVYEQDVDAEDVPLGEVDVFLLDGTTERQTTTRSGGVFAFANLNPGTYFLDIGITPDHECTSHNRSVRVPEAIREGALHIVSIGDSIGVLGSDHPYPEKLADRFAGLADTTFDNLHVAGSTSWDWLPGADTGYFDDRLAPVLPDTDLLTYTLGGNDLGVYLPPGGPPYDVLQIIMNFLQNPQYMAEIIPNITEIAAAAHDINPDCDIVYAVYPNFGNSTYLIEMIGSDLQPFASLLARAVLSLLRWRMSETEWIVLADMLDALGDTWLDPYLIDIVHPSDAGHQRYADEIFTSLGGIVLEEGRIGESRRWFGFDAPDLIPSHHSAMIAESPAR